MQVVVALQPLVSRETSPTDSAVVSVSEFNTGGTLRRLRADSAPCCSPALLRACCLLVSERHNAVTSKSICAGPGASNVISDSVSMSGTLRAITTSHFERMRDRITEAGFLILPAPPSNVPMHIYFGVPASPLNVSGGHACSDSASGILFLYLSF